MAGFRRRTSKTIEENQVAENQGELEMSTSVDDKAESSNEQNLFENATSEQNNESEESVPVKKKRTIVKKVSDSQKQHLQQTQSENITIVLFLEIFHKKHFKQKLTCLKICKIMSQNLVWKLMNLPRKECRNFES